MKPSDYKFKVGDKIITTEGETGTIVQICECVKCVERGFYEPTWVSDESGEFMYITDCDAADGFSGYHKIGEHRFSDLDEITVLNRIRNYRNELGKLCNQLEFIKALKDLEKRG